MEEVTFADPVYVIAAITHEANRLYCQGLGDMSQPSWADAPLWQKESAIAGVESHLLDPDMTPACSHVKWSEQKVKDGWVYGDVKDPDATPPTHPCLVPYAELPRHQQTKDKLFKAIVDALREEV